MEALAPLPLGFYSPRDKLFKETELLSITPLLKCIAFFLFFFFLRCAGLSSKIHA